ncbi:hypothetical protein [Streptomyces sp. NPDC001657]|uniref:hypothetical protein n=1 Tax=Streptomyces sp. NPDC001657 TaxID=3154522 RepID=UPI00332A6891
MSSAAVPPQTRVTDTTSPHTKGADCTYYDHEPYVGQDHDDLEYQVYPETIGSEQLADRRQTQALLRRGFMVDAAAHLGMPWHPTAATSVRRASRSWFIWSSSMAWWMPWTVECSHSSGIMPSWSPYSLSSSWWALAYSQNSGYSLSRMRACGKGPPSFQMCPRYKTPPGSEMEGKARKRQMAVPLAPGLRYPEVRWREHSAQTRLRHRHPGRGCRLLGAEAAKVSLPPAHDPVAPPPPSHDLARGTAADRSVVYQQHNAVGLRAQD